MHIPDFGWDIGSTDDLGALVEAIAAWREGVPYGELASRFGFLDLDGFTGALAAGEPTATQWAGLLSSAYYRGAAGPPAPPPRGRDAAERVPDDDAPRGPPPGGPDALGEPPGPGVRAGDGHYEVLRAGTARTEVPDDDLIAHLREALYE